MMAAVPPRWVVVGASADVQRKLCEDIALRYGVVHVSASNLSSTPDGSNDIAAARPDQVGRLHAADCAVHGWVLDGMPPALEQCNALAAEDLLPHMVFDLIGTEDTALANSRTHCDAVVQLWTTAASTTAITLCAIPSTESSDSIAASTFRAIDTRTWTLHLECGAPTLASDDPDAVADIVQVTVWLPLPEQVAAMHLLTSLLNSPGLAGLTPDCGGSVVALVQVYTKATKSTQATLARRFPPELVAMLPFVETLTPHALMTMAPLAREILSDASAGGAIQPATAVKVHTAFFNGLSEKERRQLVRLLPPKEQELVTHVVETTEGLSPRGVETVVHMLLQSTAPPGSSSATHPPRGHVAASSLAGVDPNADETSVHHPFADPTYGAIDMPDHAPPPSRDAVMAKLALTATKAHGRRLLRWVRSAPRSLRVLSFVSSVLLLVTSTVAMVLDLVSGRLIVLVINAWIIFFSLMIVSLEVKITAVEKHNPVATHFPLVGTVAGRGVFLLFVSMLAMTLAVKATWQNALLGVAGVVACLVSVWTIALGSLASHQFNVLRTRIESPAQLKHAFDHADVDGAGELDVDGLARFCLVWQWPIDAYFLEAIARDLDGDNSNTVSLSDMQVWWSRAQHDSALPALPPDAAQVSQRPTSALKLVNIFTGILTVVTGVVGNIAAFHDRDETVGEVAVYMVLDLWVMLFGLVLVVVEAPPSWPRVVTDSKRFLVDNFASFLASIFGRSLFCLFVGTFVVSVYQNDSVYLPIVTGAWLVLVSLVNTCVGRGAKTQFLALAKAVDVSNCGYIFAAADKDGDGMWSLDELDAFCKAQQVVLSPAQWEILVADLDQHHIGAVSLHDFTAWVQLQHRNMDFV